MLTYRLTINSDIYFYYVIYFKLIKKYGLHNLFFRTHTKSAMSSTSTFEMSIEISPYLAPIISSAQLIGVIFLNLVENLNFGR